MILTIDNFFDNPEDEHIVATTANYQTIPHNDHAYEGICLTEDPKGCLKIKSWARSQTKLNQELCFYRHYLPNQKHPTYIHTDAPIGELSAIVFLNKEPQGGLAFWRHRVTGWTKHPDQKTLDDLFLPPNAAADLFLQIQKQGWEEKYWDLTCFVAMKFNTAVVFDANLYHSRYPMEPHYDCAEGGRLVKAYFLGDNTVYGGTE